MGRVTLVAISLLLSATQARAGGSGPPTAPTRAVPSRAKPQQVQIGAPKRKVTIAERMMRLAKIRTLPAPAREVRAGLRRYRSVRGRIRELRSRMGASIRVRSLAKLDSFVIDRIDFGSANGARKKPKVLIVGGVHAGSERIGVESALQVAEQMGANKDLLEHFDVTVVPLANPSGLAIRSRRNKDDVDVNRSFDSKLWTRESAVMAKLMKKEKFDVVIDLHGAGTFRTGFFVIRGGDDGGAAKRFVRTLEPHQLLDSKGAGNTYKLDAPGVVTSSNKGTLKQFAIDSGAKYAYTFEAPKRFAPEAQIAGTVKLVFSALKEVRSRGQLGAR